MRGNLVKLRAQAPLYGRDDALEDLVKLRAQAPLGVPFDPRRPC
jgi:hypothetical protein